MNRVFKAYLSLIKPGVTGMVLVTASVGFYLGADVFRWPHFFSALAGVSLTAAGANALNQWMEREADARMERTKTRPLPSGKLGGRSALVFGSLLSFLGVAVNFYFVNRSTAFAALASLVSYLFLYTPLKRKTVYNTFVGAVAGAIPALMGWTAAQGRLELAAFALFLILFVWQLPHVFAIAWVYRKDYKNGGFRMMTLTDESGLRTAWQIAGGAFLVFLASLLPAFLGIAGPAYLSIALFAGIVFTGFAVCLVSSRLRYAKEFIPVSIIYLAVLHITLLTDKMG
ncbi:MAG: protoheme IX farnesyltransferase [Candidatus Omnitrophica bacterium]|nr:protoheme IX farnesyltransferase [Candidatus Omnitrophota bacterium]